MDSVDPNVRASACNVLFLDGVGIPFAGLYQDPKQPLVLFQDALQELVNSFQLNYEDGGKFESWLLVPSNQWKLNAGRGEPCDGVLTKDLSSEEGNMMKPILPGRYYLYRRKKHWMYWQASSAVPCAISGQDRPSKRSDKVKVPELFAFPIVPEEMLVDVPPKDLPLNDDEKPLHQNWIPMLSRLYNFFAAGEIGIHPDTLVIRCFRWGKHIQPYHGRIAVLKDTSPVYRKILGLHYQQCIYVGITAHGIPLRPPGLDDWHFRITDHFLDEYSALDVTKAIDHEYCTQACLRGVCELSEDFRAMDPDCPNFKKHQAYQANNPELEAEEGKHRVYPEDLVLLLQAQLSHDQSTYCIQPQASTQGHHGQFFKVTLATFGYTLVGKGVRAAEKHKVVHEANIYARMDSLQGECVPVCFGSFALQVPCGEHTYNEEEITHMLLLSHAGIAVENDNGEEPDLPVDDEEVQLEAMRTFDEINACGVKRSDKRKKHQFWNEETRRVFFIDFEKDSFR